MAALCSNSPRPFGICQPHFDSAQVTAVPNCLVPRILLRAATHYDLHYSWVGLSFYKRGGLEGCSLITHQTVDNSLSVCVCTNICVPYVLWPLLHNLLLFPLDDNFFSLDFLIHFAPTHFAYLIVIFVIIAKTITVYKSICLHEQSIRFFLWGAIFLLFLVLCFPHCSCSLHADSFSIPTMLGVCCEFKKRRIYLGNMLLSFRCFP